jgi:hypothetical protein
MFTKINVYLIDSCLPFDAQVLFKIYLFKICLSYLTSIYHVWSKNGIHNLLSLVITIKILPIFFGFLWLDYKLCNGEDQAQYLTFFMAYNACTTL